MKYQVQIVATILVASCLSFSSGLPYYSGYPYGVRPYGYGYPGYPLYHSMAAYYSAPAAVAPLVAGGINSASDSMALDGDDAGNHDSHSGDVMAVNMGNYGNGYRYMGYVGYGGYMGYGGYGRRYGGYQGYGGYGGYRGYGGYGLVGLRAPPMEYGRGRGVDGDDGYPGLQGLSRTDIPRGCGPGSEWRSECEPRPRECGPETHDGPRVIFIR